MKAFRFSLQALLTLRQRQESLALEGYGRALTSHRAATTAVECANRELFQAWTTMRRQMEDRCTAGDVRLQRAQSAALEERARRAQADLQIAENRVRSAFDVLIEARQQRQMVDRLQEQRYHLFHREVARQDARFLDDLAGQTAHRALSGQAPP